MNWLKQLRGRVRKREELWRHTTFQIGGEARFFIEPRDTADLKVLLTFLKRYTIPFFIIGGGSNLLAPDGGLNAVVIRLSAPFFTAVSCEEDRVRAGAGVRVARLLKDMRDRGLSGLEFLTHIPGTLGGALVMNAGQGRGRHALADVLESVQVMDRRGRVHTLASTRIAFGYRRSGLSRYIVLGAVLRLKKAPVRSIDARLARFRTYRNNQDYSYPSAGCIFKNPSGRTAGRPAWPAGRLIDECGLKGMRVGGAQVSTLHANFIVNRGNARAVEVRALMAEIQQTVKHMHGILLKSELVIWE